MSKTNESEFYIDIQGIDFHRPSDISKKELVTKIDKLFTILITSTDEILISKTIPILQSYQTELDLRSSEISDKASLRFARWSIVLVILSILLSLASVYYAANDDKTDNIWRNSQNNFLSSIDTTNNFLLKEIIKLNEELKLKPNK